MTKRILSGLQPSGRPHLGNYFGAMKQHVELQELADVERYYFIADYHAMTTVKDADTLRRYVREVAEDYLALGLDPERSVFFRQSDVPEVLELAWMLATVTGMGLLERAHSYKDKIANGIKPSVGLFYYPVLMAADILAYKSHLVPVGQDQVQHIEMAQDMAGYFDGTYGSKVFVRPEPRLEAAGAKVPGIDGQKMSKSYGNTVELRMKGKELRKRLLSIVTDSTPVEAAKDPATCNVYALYSLFATPEERAAMATRYRAGGLGYGHVKLELFDKMEAHFAPYHTKLAELAARPSYVDDVLAAGAAKAREVARATLDEARRACGLG